MIEVEVHQQLRAFLRYQGKPYWPHHLTMARLVARALRLGRSALIQTGCYGCHQLSYLMPLLMWDGPVILVVPEPLRQRLELVDMPQLQQWMQVDKAIRTGDRWPDEDFQGVLVVSPNSWLGEVLAFSEASSQPSSQASSQNRDRRFPIGIPTIIDGAEELEELTLKQLSANIEPADWNRLALVRPDLAETIRDIRVKLTRAIFQHPANPYECCVLEKEERQILRQLYQLLEETILPSSWNRFWQRFEAVEEFSASGTATATITPTIVSASIDRSMGQWTLSCSPVEVSAALARVWPQQPVVLIGSALDLEPKASIYRQQVGLGDVTCVKFSPDPDRKLIRLYQPDRFPMPNTPQFQQSLIQELRSLLCIGASRDGLTTILVGDMPLRTRVGSLLAAEFGSRVQVEKIEVDEKSILVAGWEFWQQNSQILPPPKLLAIATLPLPSLEDPIVAGRVRYYKQRRLDWFRLYLLPTALSTLQRATATVRHSFGVVALLDSRVIHRTYGQQVLAALSPYSRIDYLDVTYFADW